MAGSGSSVTLILYQIGDKWWREPGLNLVAAVAQWSSYTHIEMAIGETAGDRGEMSNVLRVFNDAVGVELTQRTGRNPAYTYLSLGCSKPAEQRMLQFARAQVKKPFSNMGMARSLIAPRTSDGNNADWFCAELVAACLQKGGLLSGDSNPGGATPHSLYKMYSKQAAASANPYVLRGMNLTLNGLTSGMSGVTSNPTCVGQHTLASHHQPLLTQRPTHAHAATFPQYSNTHGSALTSSTSSQPAPLNNVGIPSRRPDSPPRASFKVMNSRGNGMEGCAGHYGDSGSNTHLSISLTGLSANSRRR